MIKDWIRKDFPYRPGAGRTGDRFGLRKDCIGSPFHTGDDRAAKPRAILMPFDGTMIWEHSYRDWESGEAYSESFPTITQQLKYK